MGRTLGPPGSHASHCHRCATRLRLLPAFAQDWIDRVDRFGVDMPRQPSIQEITYTSWRGHKVPARIHAVQDGASRYSVTVVNYASDTDMTDVLGSIAFAATNSASAAAKSPSTLPTGRRIPDTSFTSGTPTEA